MQRRHLVAALCTGVLAASIEGQRNGAPRSVAFPMTRVSCDARAHSR
jgi:hypothetical protein